MPLASAPSAADQRGSQLVAVASRPEAEGFAGLQLLRPLPVGVRPKATSERPAAGSSRVSMKHGYLYRCLRCLV